MDKKEVLVLGTGVSGLSSGILLLKNGYEVTIWAKDLPPNTTSNKAGAFWYPYLSNPQDKVTKWAKFTLEYLKKEFLNDPKTGCIMRTATEIFDTKVDEPGWKGAAEYRRPTENELPKGYIDGYQVEAVMMDTSYYMDYLVNIFKNLGGIIIQKTVSNIDEAFAEYNNVVNCTSIGSKELFNDSSLYPVRGQIVKVKPNGFNQVIADDAAHNNLAYIIPRINDIILGGTAQVNDWNLEVNPEDTKEILRKAAEIAPEFKKVEIIGESVGLRPARSEVRLEAEKFGDKTVIHNYGHGGSGFTLSWGCAQEVVTLVNSL